MAGLSGAVHPPGRYDSITAALKDQQKQILWLNSTDPAVHWGRTLKCLRSRDSLAVPNWNHCGMNSRLAAVMGSGENPAGNIRAGLPGRVLTLPLQEGPGANALF